ncbi:MAG: InlB B-repeat-containing protein, partial [Oscillospiraceae bacterium]|nr:InlB B-repeat-containing protein [Oscillospiraceae bacterium]
MNVIFAKGIKKPIAILLAFIMLFSALPLMAFATDDDGIENDPVQCVCGQFDCDIDHIICDVCEELDCDKVHIKCDICEEWDCVNDHNQCSVCNEYDCEKVHIKCDVCDTWDCTKEHKQCNVCGEWDCEDDHDSFIGIRALGDEIPEVEYFTVTYYDPEGEVLHTEEIQEDSFAKEYPSIDPEDFGAMIFKGWFTDPDPSDTDLPYDPTSPVTKDLDLYAVCSNVYLISFMDEAGTNVEYTVTRDLGQFIGNPPADVEATVTPPGMRLVGWYDSKDDTKTIIELTTAKAGGADGTDHRNLYLKPLFSNSWLVIFVSTGTQVVPQVVQNGNLIDSSSITTKREGYNFLNWRVGSETGAVFNPETDAIEQNTVLWATWEGETVEYTVALWMEIPNYADGDPNKFPTPYQTPEEPDFLKGYNYVGSIKLTGTAGEDTNAEILKTSSLFTTHDMLKYAEFQAADVRKILGNGQTVVNLYATRKVYTYQFDLNAANRTLTVNGTTYGRNADTTPKWYTLDVKYEMNIANKFPVYGSTFASNNFNLTSWVRPTIMRWKDSAAIASVRLVVDDGMLSQDGQTTIYRFTPNTSTNNDQIRYRYFVAAYPGQVLTGLTTVTRGTGTSAITYVLMTEYNQVYNGDLGQKTINGLNKVSTSWTSNGTTYEWAGYTEDWNEDNNTGADYRCFFYTRIPQTLEFDFCAKTSEITNASESVFANKTVLFSEPMTLYEPYDFVNKEPIDPIRPGYDFIGWFKDADYKEKFDFDATMPIGGAIAYAQWESQDNTVIFKYYESDTGPIDDVDEVNYSQGVANGECAVEKMGYLVPGVSFVTGKGLFLGWEYRANGISMPFDFGMPIWTDYEVYGIWKTTGFKVTYDLDGGLPGPAPVDPKTYELYTQAVVMGTDAVKGDHVFYAWKVKGGTALYYPGTLIDMYTTEGLELVAQYLPEAELITIWFVENYIGSLTSIP